MACWFDCDIHVKRAWLSLTTAEVGCPPQQRQPPLVPVNKDLCRRVVFVKRNIVVFVSRIILPKVDSPSRREVFERGSFTERGTTVDKNEDATL